MQAYHLSQSSKFNRSIGWCLGSAVNDWLEQCPVDLAPVIKAGIAAMIQAINV